MKITGDKYSMLTEPNRTHPAQSKSGHDIPPFGKGRPGGIFCELQK